MKNSPYAGKPQPEEIIEAILILRHKTELPSPLDPKVIIHERGYLTHREFEKNYGAPPEYLERIRAFAAKNNLSVLDPAPAERKVTLRGTLKAFSLAFGIDFFLEEHRGVVYRVYKGLEVMPEELRDIALAILGLDNQPAANISAADILHFLDEDRSDGESSLREVFSLSSIPALLAKLPAYSLPQPADIFNLKSALSDIRALFSKGEGQNFWSELFEKTKSDPVASLKNIFSFPAALPALIDRYTSFFTPPEGAKLYKFPQDADGSGQCIGIVALGGGFRKKHLENYFKWLGLPVPEISFVAVAGAGNSPGFSREDGFLNSLVGDVEVNLDIEICGAMAPGAKLVVYYAPFSELGLYAAFNAAITDQIHKPSVLSLSWFLPNERITPLTLDLFDSLFKEAAYKGITICAASGDRGSFDHGVDHLLPYPVVRMMGGKTDVIFPAGHPLVLSCGGTSLEARDGEIIKETVWNSFIGGTGGGISERFPVPSYQENANVPPSVNGQDIRGRGVPDVAAIGDPLTGFLFQVHAMPILGGGGTSAAAPQWAALIARLNQRLDTRLGFLHPLLYKIKHSHPEAFNEILEGDNVAYSAGPGWNACTGLGSPNGEKLLEALAEVLKKRNLEETHT